MDSFFIKSNINNLKIQTNNSDSYSVPLICILKRNKAKFHTYQPHDEKSFRVVIRNTHPLTSLAEIGIAINEIRSFRVLSVSNVLKKNTKNKLPIFFIDLEPADNFNTICCIRIIISKKSTQTINLFLQFPLI